METKKVQLVSKFFKIIFKNFDNFVVTKIRYEVITR
jgi:hypothetical protein